MAKCGKKRRRKGRSLGPLRDLCSVMAPDGKWYDIPEDRLPASGGMDDGWWKEYIASGGRAPNMDLDFDPDNPGDYIYNDDTDLPEEDASMSIKDEVERIKQKWSKEDEKDKNDTKVSPGFTYTSPGYTASTWRACYHDASAVYFIGEGKKKVTYSGGSCVRVEAGLPFDGLVVNLLGDSRPPSGVGGDEGWVTPLQKFTRAQKHWLSIKWPDYGIPTSIEFGFWGALHEEIKRRGVKRVLIYCQGGHGRTGTALAAILTETLGYSGSEAVKFVRENYCNQAVENKTQENYLKDLAADFRRRAGKPPIVEPPPAPVVPKVDDALLRGSGSDGQWSHKYVCNETGCYLITVENSLFCQKHKPNAVTSLNPTED